MCEEGVEVCEEGVEVCEEGVEVCEEGVEVCEECVGACEGYNNVVLQEQSAANPDSPLHCSYLTRVHSLASPLNGDNSSNHRNADSVHYY